MLSSETYRYFYALYDMMDMNNSTHHSVCSVTLYLYIVNSCNMSDTVYYQSKHLRGSGIYYIIQIIVAVFNTTNLFLMPRYHINIHVYIILKHGGRVCCLRFQCGIAILLAVSCLHFCYNPACWFRIDNAFRLSIPFSSHWTVVLTETCCQFRTSIPDCNRSEEFWLYVESHEQIAWVKLTGSADGKLPFMSSDLF